MMKTKKFLAIAAIVAAMATAAVAENMAAAPDGKKGRAMPEKTFEERKAGTLKRISNRIAQMQKKQACIQAAASHEAMQACFPNMGKRGGHGPKSDKAPKQ